MRHPDTRPAVALLTFALGVTLVTIGLFVAPHKHPPAPATQPAQEPAPPQVEKQPEKAQEQPELQPLPDRFVKVGDLPRHDQDEERGFRVQFVSESAGWLVNGAKLWRTTDGGATWESVYSMGKASRFDKDYIDRLTFVSPRDGWMLTNDKLYRTGDGGRTWLPLPMPGGDSYYSEVDFLPDGRRGWLAGGVCAPFRKGEDTANRFHCSATSATVAAVFMTSDGGNTWRRQTVSRMFGDIFYLKMRDAHSGFAVGQAGAFRYEGGRWLDAQSAFEGRNDPEDTPGEYGLEIAIGMPTFCPVNFHFTDGRHGWLTNSNGYVARTNDGGRTWVDISRCDEGEGHADPPYFSTLFISGDGRGLALDTDGGLQETEDGGVTWGQVAEPGTFTGMFALAAGKTWLVAGDGIYRDTGTRK